jgi:hypothetical protein
MRIASQRAVNRPRIPSRGGSFRFSAVGRRNNRGDGTVHCLWIIGMAALLRASVAAAQSAVPEIAYVEEVSGRAIVNAQGQESQLDLLDTIANGAQLMLERGARLKICHYGLHELIAVQGPLRGSVSRVGILTENGQPVASTGRRCTEPVVSTVQGGIAFRSAGEAPGMRVPLRPAIKLSNAGTLPIRRVTLWDDKRERLIAPFEKAISRPSLDDGTQYQLVIEFNDGTERTVTLRASVDSVASVVLIKVR